VLIYSIRVYWELVFHYIPRVTYGGLSFNNLVSLTFNHDLNLIHMPLRKDFLRFVIHKRHFFLQQASRSLLVLIIFFHSPNINAQRAKIDSLKSLLPNLHDTAHVDVLNVLGLVYTNLNLDTAKAFTQKAYGEAKSMNYISGIGMSLNNSARIAGYGYHDFKRQEEISLECIELLKDRRENRQLIAANMNLALSLFFQSRFDRSTEVCDSIVKLSEVAGYKTGVGEALTIMGSISFEIGNYGDAFEYFNRSLDIFKNVQDSYNAAILLTKIGDLYKLAGDQNTALNYYYQSLEYAKGSSLVWHPLEDLGDFYYSLQVNDTTGIGQDNYLQTIKSLTIRSNDLTFPRLRDAEILLARKEYDSALVLLKEEMKSPAGTNLPMRFLRDMARAYEGKKDYTPALDYTKQLLQNSQKYKAKRYLQDGYNLMYIIYDQLKRQDSAYIYYQKYTMIKDSIALDDFGRKLATFKALADNEKKESRIELLNHEKLVSQQQLQLREQEIERAAFQKKLMIASIIGFILLVVIIIRNIFLQYKNESNRHKIVEQELTLQKLESEKVRTDLQQKAAMLEMEVLRAQMNPHFIFNSLNSINRFILQNNRVLASEHLTKFSKLVRLILENSQVSLISLETELETLKLYIELEAVRFDDHFDFEILISDDVDVSGIQVPPLIIQPYVENAIWHGLMPREEKGHLRISLFLQEDWLGCRITDDGIGRKKAAELKSKLSSSHNSMGMRITAERIAMINPDLPIESYVTVTDVELADSSPGGTEVYLKIPIQDD